MAAQTQEWNETKQNLTRAGRGNHAADQYVKKFARTVRFANERDATRLVADLMHWLAARGDSPETAIEAAVSLFDHESRS